MTSYTINTWFKAIALPLVFLLLAVSSAFAGNKIPDKPAVPRLVNDLAQVLSADEQRILEEKLVHYEQTTSNEITVITVNSLEGYDVSDFAIRLGNAWGVGKKGRNNGVVILAAIQDRKINISTGKGLEGALPDIICGRIIRHEMQPAFREENYFLGFSKAADAVIAATKGEYKAQKKHTTDKKAVKAIGVFIVFIIVMIIIMARRGGGGGGGGNYMSGRGIGDIATGVLLGQLLGGRGGHGGGGFGGGGFGGGSSGGGGFGGFGGGGFGGGGASGGW